LTGNRTPNADGGSPAWYRANRPTDKDGLQRVEEALLNWTPDILNFGEAALICPDGGMIAA